MAATGPQLRFCPESNDLLYPQEDPEHRRLIYKCRNCGYSEPADPSNWCVYRWGPPPFLSSAFGLHELAAAR